jgi:hypothetical protein
MSSGDPAHEIAVYGATGTVGRRLCDELARMGAAVIVVGRRAAALGELATTLARARASIAELDDPAALAHAFAGARVVVNAAGPQRDTAAAVLAAALAAGAHYVDVGGEQEVLRALYERHESAVRRAGVVALPAAGVDCALGDLAAAWAAGHLLGVDDPGDAVRSEPAPRLAEQHPLDDITVSYVFDQLARPPGSQRAAFDAVGNRPLIWRRDRWEAATAGDHRRINAGPARGGERDAVVHAAGDVITIPRHLAARRVTGQLSTTRHPGTATALRLLARALPFLPRRAGEWLVPYALADADYRATRLAVIAQVRRGFSAAQIVVAGHDLVRTTAVIAAWSACRLAERGRGPVGMRAAAELFRPEPALRAIARAADLTIEPSFG